MNRMTVETQTNDMKLMSSMQSRQKLTMVHDHFDVRRLVTFDFDVFSTRMSKAKLILATLDVFSVVSRYVSGACHTLPHYRQERRTERDKIH